MFGSKIKFSPVKINAREGESDPDSIVHNYQPLSFSNRMKMTQDGEHVDRHSSLSNCIEQGLT